MVKKRIFQRRRLIAVDVDGTILLSSGENQLAVAFLKSRKAEGFDLMLWSARGEDHAREVATRFGIANLFKTICAKPGYILDDKGWEWIKYTKVIRNLTENTDGES
jgi:hydroxymethylpyrimidine pyrophosphatase-like HAD family hydrolase